MFTLSFSSLILFFSQIYVVLGVCSYDPGNGRSSYAGSCHSWWYQSGAEYFIPHQSLVERESFFVGFLWNCGREVSVRRQWKSRCSSFFILYLVNFNKDHPIFSFKTFCSYYFFPQICIVFGVGNWDPGYRMILLWGFYCLYPSGISDLSLVPVVWIKPSITREDWLMY